LPLAGGIILLISVFSLLILGLMVYLGILVFGGTACIRGTFV